MTVLVLGGAGYVGSHAVEMLVAKGYDVAVVDNLVTGHRAAVPANIRFYEGDVRDRAFMEEVFSIEKNIEGVMHFCAYSLVGESMQKPAMYFDNNVGGCITLLEVMEQF
ncbi:MAG: NAD-dependent epimerase/dehydratase family protein, partial [Lactococcus sp.]